MTPAVRSRHAVSDSPELRRVLALPPAGEIGVDLIDALSALLRKRSDVRLFPQQAATLIALLTCPGVFAPLPCGDGKTLISLVAATLLGAQRPVLLIPKGLEEKTRRDYAELFLSWHVRLPTIVSYQSLSRANQHTLLEALAPDLVICDEAHALRNTDAACTRRFLRWAAASGAKILVMSGTLVTDRLADYGHLFAAPMREAAPVPRTEEERTQWAAALDRDVPTLARWDLGALAPLGDVHEHMLTRQGVVRGSAAEFPGALEFSRFTIDLPPALANLVEAVERSGLRPDGELLTPSETAACVACLVTGFYYVWDPVPPAWWLDPRRVLWQWVRGRLDEHDPRYDSPEQLTRAIDAGVLRDGAAELAAWRAVADRYTPTVRAVWVDRAPVRALVERARTGDPALVWVRYRALGEALAAAGVPYYGRETHPGAVAGARSIAVSIGAHATGSNLQAWARAIVAHPPSSAEVWEQLISREARTGQRADVVSHEILVHTDKQHERIDRARARARAIAAKSKLPQKLAYGTWKGNAQ